MADIRVEIEGHPPMSFPEGTDPKVIDMVVKRDVLKVANPKIDKYPEEVKQKIRDTGASILEEGAKFVGQVGAMGIGAAKGTVYGAPYGPYGMIAGGLLGGAAGYAAVETADRSRKGEKLTAGTLTEDLGTGLIAEAGGQSVGGAIKVGKEAIARTNIPRNIYASAIKTPLTGNWKKVLPGRDYSMRELTTLTGLTESQIVNKEAPALIQAKIDDLTDSVSRIVDDLTKKATPDTRVKPPFETTMSKQTSRSLDPMFKEVAGGGKTGDIIPGQYMTKVSDVNSALGPVRGKAQASDPSSLGYITDVEQRALRIGGTGSSLTPNQLNLLKQQAQADINWDRTKPILQPNGRFREDALRAVANRSMELLEQMDPTIKYLNKKASAYINLKEAVENTLARQWNKDIVPATSKMLALGHMGLAALDTIMSFPSVRSRLAIALGRASGLPANATGRAAALTINQMNKKTTGGE